VGRPPSAEARVKESNRDSRANYFRVAVLNLASTEQSTALRRIPLEGEMRMHWRVKLSLLLLLLNLPAFAQDEKAGLEATIRHEDAAFWDAYNRCDVEKMSLFFWPDIEFYHDKGGLTIGLGPFVEKLKTGLCGKPNYRLRREAVPDTVQVYPLQNNGVTYGAVISGEHYFYINDSGKPEYRDGVAKFFHVWLLKDGVWKMGRVVSYEHRDAPYQNARKEVRFSPRCSRSTLASTGRPIMAF
jgi:hypothetical protein